MTPELAALDFLGSNIERLERCARAAPRTGLAMLLEDNDAAAAVYARVLRNAGHTVTVCGTIAEAKRALLTADFDLAILDMHLPDGYGWDLARSLPDDMGVVVISGVIGADTLAAIGGRMRAAHLVKPFEENALLAAVAVALDG